MSKKNNTQSKQKNSTRILALILAILMLGGAVGIIINIFAATAGDPHAGHDHATVEYVEYV